LGKIHLDDVQGLFNRPLGIKREPGIDLSGHLSRDNVQDLLSELDQETVEGGIDLLI